VADKLKLQCKDCGRVFYNEERKDLCFPCFNLKKYREACKLPYKPGDIKSNANSLGQRDSKAAELKPSISHTAVETLGFDDEAALLESCWDRVHEFKRKPNAEQAASLCGMLFISLSKTMHIKEMRR
jgi:hypothetical protein